MILMNTLAKEVNFPEEIIIEILSRLPVKSLIRFRSVSKSWHSIIIDPNFIKKHLSQATRHNNHNLKRALLCTSESSKLISCQVSCLSNNNNNFIDEAEKLHPFIFSESEKKKVVGGRVFIFGACNGLFWIWISKEMFLWNPSTRKIKKLPRPPFHISIHIHNGGFFPGFNVSALGYDPCNDDYKILSVAKFPIERAETMLYSLNNDSWKIVTTQNHSPNYCTRDIRTAGKFVNGAFHWLIQVKPDQQEEDSSTTSYAVVSFDLSEERYKEFVSLPNDLVIMQKSRDYERMSYDLAVLKGMLCLYCNYYLEHHRFILWAIQEYGNKKSWTKLFEFKYNYNYHNEPLSSKTFVYVVPKFLLENGELVVEARNVGDRSVAIVKYQEQGLVAVVSSGLTHLGETHIYPQSLVLSL